MSDPRPDQTLPGDLPRQTRTVLEYLENLYPKYFDPASPDYIDPGIIDILIDIAEDARPKCLNERLGNLAVAYYVVYLIEERNKELGDTGGGGGASNSGIVLSEREGDISTTYADPRETGPGETNPPSSAWEKWHRLYELCRYGAITTWVGRPTGG